MNLVQRKLLMGGLVAAFAVQTALVYTDDTASSFETLSEEALRGRRLWHEYNCQTCHQIHGFGGFLGPDLTNAARRLTDERLTEVLTVGTAQMPAFHFDEDQVYQLATFLDELSVMGVGVPRAVQPVDLGVVLAAIDSRLAEASPGEAVARGAGAFKMNCISCHVPLQATPLGLQTAPDLSTALRRIDEAAVRDTITNGRPERGMQAWQHLGEQPIADLTAFVKWLNDDRDAIAAQAGGAGVAQPIPWWEYR
ncbi:MAG: c-type cytochrome [Planctomycetota bacterium]